MKCNFCGNEIREGAAFCSKCGTAVQPPAVPVPPKKEKKPIRKPLLAGLCLIAAALVILAVWLVPRLFPGKETVYVLSGYRSIGKDGEVLGRNTNLEYDEFGNPLWEGNLYALFANMGGTVRPAEDMEFDDRGNLVQFHDFEFEYEYDKKGQITSCVQYCQEEEVTTWDFTWDDRGRLIQAISQEPYAGNGQGVLRGDFEYDKEGRLVREYLYSVFLSGNRPGFLCYEYSYNTDGLLETVERGYVPVESDSYADTAPQHLDYDMEDFLTFDYEDGRMEEVERLDGGMSVSYRYDRDGNLKLPDSCDYDYDENGNLTKIQFPNGTSVKFEFEAVEMTQEAAQRYRRWERLMYMDFPELLSGAQGYFGHLHPCAGSNPLFFYYLVPNPFW